MTAQRGIFETDNNLLNIASGRDFFKNFAALRAVPDPPVAFFSQ